MPLESIIHQRRWLAAAILIALLFGADVAAASTLIEVTFDDQDDGTGAQTGHANVDNLQNNFASLGQGYRAVELTGSAQRSAFSEGRYGRAADLVQGQGAIRITGWNVTDNPTVTAYMWVKARELANGSLIEVPDCLSLGFAEGGLVIRTWDEHGAVTEHSSVASWPDDGEFHHLTVAFNRVEPMVSVQLGIDFAPADELVLALVPPPDGTAVLLGNGFDGLIDELLVVAREPSGGDVWDLSPDAICPTGLVCLEEVIATTPRSFTHQVPVRMKSVVDPQQCSAASPCPLLLVISGGGKCADNYAPQGTTGYYAADGFMAVTIDPYCEGDPEFTIYPFETSQLVAAKNHLMQSSPLSALIAGPDYAATGCSHGCNSVTHLMVFEQDYPKRTFGNSCSMDWMVCAYAADQLCPAIADYLEQRAIAEAGSLDFEHERAQQSYEQQPIAHLSAEVAATRDFASAWGLSLEGQLCTADGYSTCFEESLWGMTYSSRRIRDIWQWLEPAANPTGYFVENHESDCQHCATVGSPAFLCGACLLKHGRQGMSTACPECLSYESPIIEPGAEALSCPVEASWYEDPLTAANAAGPTVGEAEDQGCGCRTAPQRQRAWLAIALTLLGVMASRCRRR